MVVVCVLVFSSSPEVYFDGSQVKPKDGPVDFANRPPKTTQEIVVVCIFSVFVIRKRSQFVGFYHVPFSRKR